MTDETIINLGDDEPEAIDFSRTLIPAGYYKAFAKQAGHQLSKNKGTPSIHIEWMVNEPAEFKNRVLFDDLWLTNLNEPGKRFNLDRIKTILKAFGAPYKGGRMELEKIIKTIKDGGYVIIKVDIKFEDDDSIYDDKNQVVGYRALNDMPEMGLGAFPDQPKPKKRKVTTAPSDKDVDLDPDMNLDEDTDLL